MITSVENLIFNGVDLADSFSDKDSGTYLIVNSVYGRGITQSDNTLIRVTGMDGAHPSYSRIPVRELVVTLTLKGESFEDLRKRVEVLNGILYTNGKDVPMKFADEPDRTYYGRLDAVTDVVEVSHIYKAELTFICADPYKYAPERILTFPEDVDTAIVDNKGETTVYPTIELTATKKSTFAMISTGGEEDSEYNLIGRPAEIDEDIIDQKTTVVYERGESLDDWTKSGTQLDEGEVSDGELGTDGSGIHPLSYGTPSGGHQGWYGPALMREINPIQDFEVEMRLRANTNRPGQLYRIEFYLYDENMNVLGKMAVRDYAVYNERYAAEGRVGEFLGGRKGYQISKDNYLRERDHFHGLVRMRRIGQRFEVYVARLKTGEDEGFHHDILEVPYTDTANEYQDKLRYIQINILRHTDGPSGSVPRINALKVTELTQATVDQTPYVIYPEDVVTFDHKTEEIFINGEPRMDLKNFGGSFFALEKGDNMLLITPEDSFETRVSLQERYL